MNEPRLLPKTSPSSFLSRKMRAAFSSSHVTLVVFLTLVTSIMAEEGTKKSREDDSHMMLMPGTNFCGRGFRAKKLSHLGAFGGPDRCCRQHDLGCPHTIQPLSSKYGLYNWRMYTAMHCSCDDRFRSCLKLERSATADTVGRVFFNLMGTRCFVFVVDDVCVRRNWWGKCTETEKQRVATWREAKPY